jgi:hypothetical protein
MIGNLLIDKMVLWGIFQDPIESISSPEVDINGL